MITERRRVEGGATDEYGRCVIGGHEAVDLGLPSGLLWATCDIDLTDQLASRGHNMYTSHGSPTINNTTIYSGTGVLPADYDAAVYSWGNGWRMPTKEECLELIDNTSWVNNISDGRLTIPKDHAPSGATTVGNNYNVTGFYGVKVVCNSDSNRYILLRKLGRVTNVLRWTATRRDSSMAYILGFTTEGTCTVSMSYVHNGMGGLAIRPVHDPI